MESPHKTTPFLYCELLDQVRGILKNIYKLFVE